MEDSILDDLINKYEGLYMHLDEIQKEIEKLQLDVHNYYNYLFSLKEIYEKNHKVK